MIHVYQKQTRISALLVPHFLEYRSRLIAVILISIKQGYILALLKVKLRNTLKVI